MQNYTIVIKKFIIDENTWKLRMIYDTSIL